MCVLKIRFGVRSVNLMTIKAYMQNACRYVIVIVTRAHDMYSVLEYIESQLNQDMLYSKTLYLESLDMYMF